MTKVWKCINTFFTRLDHEKNYMEYLRAEYKFEYEQMQQQIRREDRSFIGLM